MEPVNNNNNSAANNDTSIFDEFGPVPEYYSQATINGFAILLGVFYASVMMAMNVNRSPNKNGTWPTVLIGLGYTIAEVYILGLIPHTNFVFTLAFNAAGGYLLSRVLWNKYLGKDVKYDKRSITAPALIGIAVVIIFVFLIFGVISIMGGG